jgi:hypothetical protein
MGSESRGQAVDNDLHNSAECVSVVASRLDFGDHPRTGIRIETTHLIVIDAGQIARSRDRP